MVTRPGKGRYRERRWSPSFLEQTGELLNWSKDAGGVGGTNFGTPEIQTKVFGLSVGDPRTSKRFGLRK